MQGFWQRLSEPYQQLPTEERLIILSVVLACLIAIAVYVIRRVRGEIYAATPPVTDHLSEFRRMRETGQINEQEYSRVVQTISATEPDFAVEEGGESREGHSVRTGVPLRESPSGGSSGSGLHRRTSSGPSLPGESRSVG